jgi:phage gpG-like protein
MAKNLNDLSKDMEKFKAQVKAFPRRAGNIVEQYSHDAFANAKWDGKSWDKRKSKDRSDRNQPDKPRALMVKTRTLQRSISVRVAGENITISTNVRYAQAHNEGLTIQHPGGTFYLPFSTVYTGRKSRGRISGMKNQQTFVKASTAAKFPQAKKTKPHNIPIPKRQFMGYSKELISKIEKELKALIEKK